MQADIYRTLKPIKNMTFEFYFLAGIALVDLVPNAFGGI